MEVIMPNAQIPHYGAQDVANARALIGNPTAVLPQVDKAEWPELLQTAWQIVAADRAAQRCAARHQPKGAA
jgi:hypothetical protein